MNCETVSELLPVLLVGALSRATEYDVLSHLALCAECRRELAFWARVSDAAGAAAETMPDELFAGIREELFGARTSTVLESLKLAGQALGLAGSACRLALAASGTRR